MPTRTKYVYSLYDLEKKAHIAFFSSLDKAREFVLAHGIKVNDHRWHKFTDGSSYGKHSAAFDFRLNNNYGEPNNQYTHFYIRIPLDENGQIKFYTS